MRAAVLRALSILIALVQAVNKWAGTQLWLTLREIREFGIGANLDAIAHKQMDSRGQLGLQTILAAMVVVIAAFLSVIVLDKFDQSVQLSDPPNNTLSTAQNETLAGFADMVSLIAPLLLVAIAVVIIGLIRRVS